MRITIFTSSLAAGGAERSVSVLAAEFASRGHQVTVVTWNTSGADFYSLPDSVVKLRVQMKGRNMSVRWYDVRGNLNRLQAIRKTIRESRPDAGISVLDGSNELFLLSSVGMRFPKLVSSQNNLVRRGHYNDRWETLRRWIYGRADAVVLLDEKSAAETQKRYPGWNCTSIPNPLVNIDENPDDGAARIIEEMSAFPLRIAAMGRLVYQKGFDMLLNAFKQVTEQIEGAGLVILGEGPLRKELENMRGELGLNDRVKMPGTIKRPHAVIGSSSLFVFSSRYEGQGMALAEAMACGVPVVSFDCPFGPSSMVLPTDGGVLVPPENTDALGAAMTRFLSDHELRTRCGRNARRISDVLAPGRIAERWEGLIRACS